MTRLKLSSGPTGAPRIGNAGQLQHQRLQLGFLAGEPGLQLRRPRPGFLRLAAKLGLFFGLGVLEHGADRIALGAQPVDLGLGPRTSPSSASNASRSSVDALVADRALDRLAVRLDEVQCQHGRLLAQASRSATCGSGRGRTAGDRARRRSSLSRPRRPKCDGRRRHRPRSARIRTRRADSPRIGAPASPHDQGVSPNRSSTRVEKVIEAGCWPVCSTLIAKCGASISAGDAAASLCRHTSSKRRIERYRSEAVDRQAGGSPCCVDAGDDRHPGREAAERVAQRARIMPAAIFVLVWSAWSAMRAPIARAARSGVKARTSAIVCSTDSRNQVARLEGVVAVGRVHRPRDRKGQALDRVAFQAEMRFAEAGGEPRAEDLQLALLRSPARTRRCASTAAPRDRPRPAAIAATPSSPICSVISA